MASARERLGAARRSLIKRDKKTRMVTGIAEDVSSVLAFGAGQAKKAKTAWEEYEAGYEELTGEKYTGKKSLFSKPKGTLDWKKKEYDRTKITKAGGFLSGEAGSVLSDELRQKYMERALPGRESSIGKVKPDWKSNLISYLTPKPVSPKGTTDKGVPFSMEKYGPKTDLTPTYTGQPTPTLSSELVEQQASSRAQRAQVGTTVELPKDTIGISEAVQGNIQSKIHAERYPEYRKRLLEGDVKKFGTSQVLPSTGMLEQYPPKRNLLDSLYENNRLRKKY